MIDIYQRLNLGRDNQIVATQTLVKESPLSARRFFGDLLNITRLFDDVVLSTESKLAL